MQKDKKTISTAVSTNIWQIFALRKSAVSGQMSVVSCVRTRAFTLVEILIVIAIFTVLTGTVLSNYRNYNTNALFANASEDITLTLREAQVYGVGTKGNTSGAGCGGTFNCSYGVYFVQGANNIVLFADVDGNRVYTGADNPPVEIINLGNAISISGLSCGGFDCSTGVASVTFQRPNPDAYIADVAPIPSTIPSPYDYISIVLKNATTGKTATTTITRAGQIYLK